MTEHYKAFKSFVMSSSTLNSMLQSQQSQRFIIKPRHSKKYLVYPTKPVSFLNRKNDEEDHELGSLTSCAPLTSGESLLGDQPTICHESFDNSNVCSEDLSLFEDVKMDDAKDKASSILKPQTTFQIYPVQASVVSSSEENANVFNNSNNGSSGYTTKLQSHDSDVMWSCYGNETAVTSSTFCEENVHHSPTESMTSLKDVTKLLSETPPQNSRLHDFSQQDIYDLNKRFRPSSQINEMSNSMPQALDLSRPKLNREPKQDENVKPLKRRRVSKGKKCKKDGEQTAAMDFSLKTPPVPRTDRKSLKSTSVVKTDTNKEFYTEEKSGTDNIRHIENDAGGDGKCHTETTVRTESKRHTKKNIETDDTRHRTKNSFGVKDVIGVENHMTADIRHNEFSENRLQILAKMSQSVLIERGQLEKDPENLEKIQESLKTSTNTTAAASSQGTNRKAKTHGCSYCGKMFAQRSSVQTHERTHTGVRPYRCEYCGRDFIDCSTYTKHVRLHTGERPYSCNVCGRGFSQSGNMLRHKAARHPEVAQSTSDLRKTKTV